MKKESEIRKAVATFVGVTALVACAHGPVSPTRSNSPDNSGGRTPATGEIGAIPKPETEAPVPKTYDSLMDAFAAIQGTDDGEQGKCMTYYQWPGRAEEWKQIADDFISKHPEIPYKPEESSGFYGPAAEYNGGYCMVMSIGTNPDATEKSGALIYVAMGETGPDIDYVLFKGDPNGPIWPPDPRVGSQGN